MKSLFMFCWILVGAGSSLAQAESSYIQCHFLKDTAIGSNGESQGSWDGPMLFAGRVLEITKVSETEVSVVNHADNGVFTNSMHLGTCSNITGLIGVENASCYSLPDSRFSQQLVISSDLVNGKVQSESISIVGNMSANPQPPAGAGLVDSYSCQWQ